MADKKSDDTSKKTKSKNKKKSTVKLQCPGCGFDKFNVRNGILESCGGCGLNATDWAYTEKYVEAAKEYVRKYSKSRGPSFHENTPRCQAPVIVGDEIQTCGSRRWAHNGEKLTYCGACGANYKGEQPKKVDEIIKSLGTPEFNPLEVPLQKELSDDGIRKIKETANESKKVNIEEHTVRD